MLASVGEKLDQLEVFHPDRMASRILGMGDVLTLIEKAEQAVCGTSRRRSSPDGQGQFTFDDFLGAADAEKRGPAQGRHQARSRPRPPLDGLEVDERQLGPSRRSCSR